jgi:hypothetical protein
MAAYRPGPATGIGLAGSAGTNGSGPVAARGYLLQEEMNAWAV